MCRILMPNLHRNFRTFGYSSPRIIKNRVYIKVLANVELDLSESLCRIYIEIFEHLATVSRTIY